jgi:hypothetical protein
VPSPPLADGVGVPQGGPKGGRVSGARAPNEAPDAGTASDSPRGGASPEGLGLSDPGIGRSPTERAFKMETRGNAGPAGGRSCLRLREAGGESGTDTPPHALAAGFAPGLTLGFLIILTLGVPGGLSLDLRGVLRRLGLVLGGVPSGGGSLELDPLGRVEEPEPPDDGVVGGSAKH